MNYLAHAYLSFNDTNLLVGNMVADCVKGKIQYALPIPIQAGIQLHRAIDNYTDTHEATQIVKHLFKPTYRLYAAAFVDVVFDYFLANDTQIFKTDVELNNFAQATYHTLQNEQQHFPTAFANLFPYMKTQNWLYNYSTDEGMRKSFGGLQKRAAYLTEVDTAFGLFLLHKDLIRSAYQVFFPELKNFAKQKAGQLLLL